MNILLAFTNILFIIVIAKRLLFSAWVLHKSKYRLNFLLPALRDQRYTRTQNILTVFRLFGFILFIPVVLYDNLSALYHLLVAVIFLCDSLFFINEIGDSRHKISLLRFKECLILIPTILALWFLYINPLIDTYFWLLTLERFALFIYLFFALAFSFPLEIYEDLRIEKTISKRKKALHLQTIAITGDHNSYTSNFVKKILLKANKPINASSELASLGEISQFMDQTIQQNKALSVLNINLQEKDDFIKAAELVRPNIFVSINGLNRKIKLRAFQMEYEIAENLRKEDLFILDISGEMPKSQTKHFWKKLKNISATVILYYIDHTSLDISNIFNSKIVYCSDIEQDNHGLTFMLNIQGKSHFMHISFLNRDQLRNLVPAIIIAYASGFSMKEISRYFSKTAQILA